MLLGGKSTWIYDAEEFLIVINETKSLSESR